MGRRFMFITLVSVSCVLPPPVGLEDENQQPWIVHNRTIPDKGEIELNTNCKRCTFSLQVEDPDPNDTLTPRFFLNYDRGGVTDRNWLDICGDVAPANEGANRFRIDCVLEVDKRFPTAEERFNTVEIWVSDRAFSDGFRAVPSDANVVMRQWTVHTRRRGTTCDGDTAEMNCE